MRSKGSRFTLGVWGLRVCSLDVAFVAATVRNRPRDCYMAVPMIVSSAEVVIFGGFKRLVASFRVAGVALRDIQTCFVTCRKLFCVAGAILLRRFQKMRCSFRGRRSTLDVSSIILRGRRSTLDVWCCVFFLRIALAGLRQVATRCKFRGRRGSLWDVLKIDGSLARNIDFEVANLKKSRRKTSILRLQSVKIGGSLARNACFDAPTCLVSSLWFSCGLAVSMGEAAKHLLFEGFQLWKLAEVSHEMFALLLPRVSSGFAVSRLESLVFVSPPCLWGKLQKLSFLEVPEQVVMSFCVAGMALCDIPTCFIPCRKCQNWRKSRMKCSFCCSHVSRLESPGFPVASPCLWGKLQNIAFSKVSKQVVMSFASQAWHFVTFQLVLYRVENVKIGGSLAWNARFAVPTCLVSSLLVFL